MDLWDFIGYRMTFQLEPNLRVQDTVFMNDIVLWPHEGVFVSCGLANRLSGDGLGFSIGGGFAF